MTCTFDLSNDFVAQLVEQQTLNLWVLSSSLSGVTVKKSRFYLLETAFLRSFGRFWNLLPTHFEKPQNGVFLHSFLLNFR